MKHRLFNLLSAVSLALCAATLALWVRSYWRSDSLATRQTVGYSGMTRIVSFLSITSSRGGLKIASYRYDHAFISPIVLDPGPLLRWNAQAPAVAIVRASPTLWNRMNFDAYRQTKALTRQTETIRAVVLPQWLIVLAMTAIPAIRWHAWRMERRRSRMGLCLHCGYDLRATPDLCPECGTVPAGSSRSESVQSTVS